MLDNFVANANQYIHTNPWLALVAVIVIVGSDFAYRGL